MNNTQQQNIRTRTQSFFRESLCYNEIDFTIGPDGRAEDIASLMRQIRQQRRELAAIKLFRFFASPKFTEAYRTILHLPDGMSAEDIRMNEAKIENAAMLISTTMENIGVMTFQRIVPFLVVSNLVGTSVIILWRKLEDWVIALRVEIDSPNGFEWFQWLAARLEQYQPAGTKPAYEAFETWAPIRLTQDS